MADSALGSALFIPESALKKIKEADDKLKQLQRTAEQTASSVKSSFGTMQGSTTGFIGALDQSYKSLVRLIMLHQKCLVVYPILVRTRLVKTFPR